MSFILSLDTTSKYVSISVSEGEEIRLEYNFISRDDLTASLIPSLDFVLNSASLKLEDIGVLGITVGPGLFTGIRVGLATLKGLVFSSGKPVVPVVSLAALANKYMDSNTPIVSLIDARRDEVYAALYTFSHGPVTEVLPPTLLHISRLKTYLENQDSFRFAGSGAEVYKEFLKEQFPSHKILHRSFFLASEVCKIAAYQYAQKNYLQNMQELLPLYIRKPDAEQNLQKREP
jgi:tRNA threonylcarbamoyladenosine biosynthesis protein TsaB